MTSVFVAEMKNVSKLASTSWLYRFVNDNISNIKMFMYGLVILLNLNVMMSSERLRHPIDVLFFDCPEDEDGKEMTQWGGWACDVPDDIRNSLYITWILGIINFLGYFVIVGFLALTEVPLMFRETMRKAEQASTDPDFDDYFDWNAFKLCFVFIGFTVVFIIIHSSNFERNDPLYYVMVVMAILWFCKNIRDFIKVPKRSGLQGFVMRTFINVYDLCVTKPFLRNHLILQLFSVLGFQDNQWFTIMLFDIFNNSVMLQDIVKSITEPAAQLGLVLYVIAITCVVFATFGYRKFGAPAFAVGDDHGDDTSSDDYICDSTFTCFWYIFYVGVPAGTISDLMNEVTVYDGGEYWSRVAYDLVFFVWLGILLFNVITGLMVDTFGALREASNERQDILENTCFISGITRAAYDDLGLPPDAPNFDYLIGTEHDVWAYVNFLAHLLEKNPTNYDGREKYVYDEISDYSLNWLPNRTSYYMERFSKSSGDHEESDEESGD